MTHKSISLYSIMCNCNIYNPITENPSVISLAKWDSQKRISFTVAQR